MTDPDTRPAIIKFVETCHRVLRTIPVEQRPAAVDSQESARMGVAASRALAVYPGPVGELIHREIQAFLDFGYRFGSSGFATQLVDHVMNTDPQRHPDMPDAVRTDASTR